jgi:hypothetical protein
MRIMPFKIGGISINYSFIYDIGKKLFAKMPDLW